MVATSSPTGLCSFLLNLAQKAILPIQCHGRCGVSESFVHQRSPRPRRCSWAANRQANGGGERDHDVGRASSEFGLQRGPSAQTVTWYARPPPCSLAALSACGGGLEGLCVTASFNVHALPLDLTGQGEHVRDVNSTPAKWKKQWTPCRVAVTRAVRSSS
jgi:hypothetical protein